MGTVTECPHPLPDKPDHPSLTVPPVCVDVSGGGFSRLSPLKEHPSRPVAWCVCVQVPEAELEYWPFLQLSVWKIIQ